MSRRFPKQVLFLTVFTALVLTSCVTARFTPTERFSLDNSRSKHQVLDTREFVIYSVEQTADILTASELDTLIGTLNERMPDIVLFHGDRSMMEAVRTSLQLNMAIISDELIIASKHYILERTRSSALIRLEKEQNLRVLTDAEVFDSGAYDESVPLMIRGGDGFDDRQIIDLLPAAAGSLYARHLLPLEGKADAGYAGMTVLEITAALAE